MVADSVVLDEDGSSDTDNEIISKSSMTTAEEENIQRSEYEMFDDFEIDDMQLENIGEFSKSRVVQGALEGLASLKQQQSDLRE